MLEKSTSNVDFSNNWQWKMSDSYAMRFISYDWKFEHDSKILCSSLKMYVHRLILSDRHHDKPPIRAAVSAVTGDERQKVVVAGYGCAYHNLL